MQTVIRVAAASAFVLLVLSCNGSSDEDPPDPGPVRAAEEQPQEVEPEPTVPMRLTDEGRDRAAQSVVVPADPRDTAFESLRFNAVRFGALDFELGRLSNSGASARDRAVLAVSRELFESLFAGELPTDALGPSLGPGGIAILEDLIWQARNLGEVRFGRVEAFGQDEVAVPYRMLGDQRIAVGELILEKVNDDWYTADIQVEITERDTTSRFDPGAVRAGG